MNTLGDYLRKARLDRGLSQPEVAKILKVTTDTVTGWELNRHESTTKLAHAIIASLGFCPLQAKSPERQLKIARLISGKTQREVAKMIGCDESNLGCIELVKENQPKTLEKIQEFIKMALV